MKYITKGVRNNWETDFQKVIGYAVCAKTHGGLELPQDTGDLVWIDRLKVKPCSLWVYGAFALKKWVLCDSNFPTKVLNDVTKISVHML